MNTATVRARLVDSMNNVMEELRNVRALTGETTDLASLWEAYIRQTLMGMETRGRTWLTARIKYANAELAKTTKKYQQLNSDLKKKEKSSIWNKKQNRARLKLDPKLKKQTADMMTAGHTLTALEKERDDLVKKIQEAETADKPPLLMEKDEVKDDIEKTKKVIETAKRKVGQTQRDILELTAAGVQQVLQNLQKDKQTLRSYSTSVKTLRMPVI
jgi:chromosome segregation ATPase